MAEHKLEDMKRILREEVRKYAGRGWGAGLRLFAILDDERDVYAVNAVGYPKHNSHNMVVVMARLLDDKIVIEVDNTNKWLIDALLQRGIQREQVILAHNGEPVPETAPDY